MCLGVYILFKMFPLVNYTSIAFQECASIFGNTYIFKVSVGLQLVITSGIVFSQLVGCI